MATTTPNIGLTKPAGTENVNLSIINENYDKIDEAIGLNATEIAKLTGLFKIVTYNASFSVSKNYYTSISANNFGFSTPEGYTPVAFLRYDTGYWDVALTEFNVKATGNTHALRIFNLGSGNINRGVVYVDVLYVKSSFVAS